MTNTTIANIRISVNRGKCNYGYYPVIHVAEKECAYKVKYDNLIMLWPKDAVEMGMIEAESIASKNNLVFVKTHKNAGLMRRA
jgi:hypothetical protein